MWLGPSDKPVVREGYWTFIGRQLCRPWLWLLFVCTLAMYFLYAWRGWLRNRIYWDIR